MGFGCHIGLAKNQYLPIGHISNMHKKMEMLVLIWLHLSERSGQCQQKKGQKMDDFRIYEL